MPCPHPYGLKVPSPDGECYACLKNAATNGHRGRLSPEALRFVGFELDASPTEASDPQWIPAALRGSAIDKQLEELAALRDRAPGYFELLRRILENEKSK